MDTGKSQGTTQSSKGLAGLSSLLNAVPFALCPCSMTHKYVQDSKYFLVCRAVHSEWKQQSNSHQEQAHQERNFFSLYYNGISCSFQGVTGIWEKLGKVMQWILVFLTSLKHSAQKNSISGNRYACGAYLCLESAVSSTRFTYQDLPLLVQKHLE